ncbi:MAG: FprA family A-type flavoprotein [Candidatus Bathyarchaeota archaeon]|nr:FprA family A-type flavoprotein [Candidatus Bathyarchaeota archaeon]
MSAKPFVLSPNVYWVGVNDSDIKLFEGLWSIPEGVSYNSYLVVGREKTALIDCVHERKAQEHFEKISQVLDISKIDYLIINHMEPDHTSAIPQLLKRAPNIKVIYTPMAQIIFKKFYQNDPAAILTKGDDMTLPLGDKTLRFIQTPWLHWPETMSTYLPEDKILFCCDAFGAFNVLPDGAVFESDIVDKQDVCSCSQKYFASVFNGQREWVLKAIEKFSKLGLEFDVLAPSHGPVFNQTAKQKLADWANWSRGSFKRKVVVVYGSMYGFTGRCLGAVEEGVAEAGGTVEIFNLSEDKAVDALTALVEAPALIVGSSTYEHEIFPKVADFLNMLKVKKYADRIAATFGSFGWSGEATRKIASELTALGFELAGPPIPVYGSPTQESLSEIKRLAKAAAEKAFQKYKATG